MNTAQGKERPKILWAEMTRLEIAEAAKKDTLVIVPVGSIEQHGPHLPINTDKISAMGSSPTGSGRSSSSMGTEGTGTSSALRSLSACGERASLSRLLATGILRPIESGKSENPPSAAWAMPVSWRHRFNFYSSPSW